MKQFRSKVLKNDVLQNDFFQLWFHWDSKTEPPLPGHFLTIRISEESVPLLRRPFALSSFDSKSNTASIIYQRRGTATTMMTAKRPGDTIDIIAPLGKPFPQRSCASKYVLVGGGIGLGPMLFLSSVLEKTETPVELVLGYRTSSLVPQTEDFCTTVPKICTDDGTLGFKGTSIDYLATHLSVDSSTVFYGCGPHPMLRALDTFAAAKSCSCFVSVEQVMACGVGACMGCVVKTVDGYKRACKEGPVFNSRDIVWE